VFVPGLLNQLDEENGIFLAQGLTARTVGVSGKRVHYADGTKSKDTMHIFPDAAGCFDLEDGGYVYASNSEVPFGFILGAGVGSFIFDSNGDLQEYRRVLEKKTCMNCGGGKTPWGTWLSGEEYNKGEVWEVDPLGIDEANKTWFGASNDENIERGRPFESAICDDRDMLNLACFATIDSGDGELRRLTPNAQILSDAISSNDYSRVLTSEGTLDYLLLDVPSNGTFSWTQDLSLAQKNAELNYQNLEGIDHYDGTLYLISKKQREVISLNLDNFTYEKSSTINGTFNEQPDQILHVLSDSEENSNSSNMIYFVEDGGCMPGLFVRDMNHEHYFPLLEKVPQKYLPSDEVTGLAFCDNHTRLMISFQRFNLFGKLLEIRKKDGLPFTGTSLNLKAHKYSNE